MLQFEKGVNLMRRILAMVLIIVSFECCYNPDRQLGVVYDKRINVVSVYSPTLHIPYSRITKCLYLKNGELRVVQAVPADVFDRIEVGDTLYERDLH